MEGGERPFKFSAAPSDLGRQSGIATALRARRASGLGEPLAHAVAAGAAEDASVLWRSLYNAPQTGRFTQMDPIGLAGGLNLYGYASGDPVNRRDSWGLKDTVIADDKAREAVNECAQVDICQQWLAWLAQDPRKWTIQTGQVANPLWLGEFDTQFDIPSGLLLGNAITIDEDFGRIRRHGQTPGGVLAHELGGHVMGTIAIQFLTPLRGEASLCGDADPAQVGRGCAESQRLKWQAGLNQARRE